MHEDQIEAAIKAGSIVERQVWFTRAELVRAITAALATPIAAQPAAAEPDKGSSLHRAIDAVESILRGNSVYFGRETILKIVNAAAPAQAAAVPEAAFYVSDHDVEMLKDKMVAGRGCFLSKYPREGFTAYARLALSQGDVSGEGEGA